jgi:hypothetical protein
LRSSPTICPARGCATRTSSPALASGADSAINLAERVASPSTCACCPRRPWPPSRLRRWPPYRRPTTPSRSRSSNRPRSGSPPP